MAQSLLFIPDISGFTKFVQTTEVEHSQHVIAELLEVLISANTQAMELAEIEGDALFFYKEEVIPSQEKLLAQIETMFTAFYSHLKILEKNRICPCNACATAPNLQLKIVVHSGQLQFLEVQGSRKPFGKQVIEAHRLLKNSINSDNYALISKEMANIIGLPSNYKSKLFDFKDGSDVYDGLEVGYLVSGIDTGNLKLKTYADPKRVDFGCAPNIVFKKQFDVSGEKLLEYITNYKYRHKWVNGVDEFTFNENEVTRLGTKHTCVISGKHLDFVTITKDAKDGQLVYGELTTSPPPVDKLYQFYIIDPLTSSSCKLTTELYWCAKSPIKKLIIALFAKRIFIKNSEEALDNLLAYTRANELVK